jgi:DNA topoisomerase-1
VGTRIALGQSGAATPPAARQGRPRRRDGARVAATVPAEAEAAEAGLRYVSDAAPGIRRRRSGSGFSYLAPDGAPVRAPQVLRRIKALAVPPAWTDVWICPSPHGHLQATGRDAKRRKQYRYHPRWREERDSAKFDRLAAFGRALPRIRERVERDLALPGLPRERVLGAVVRLLETSLIRVGNEEYARTNHSYGLTTLRNRHLDLNGTELRFAFRGKSGKRHAISVRDRRLAAVVRRCQNLPGQELFKYLDDAGEHRAVNSEDVNAYLRDLAGEDFTAKDFRTWAGTVLAVRVLRACDPRGSETEARRNVGAALQEVAERLGNTPNVCRRCYVHPAVIEAYLDGTLDAAAGRTDGAPGAGGLSDEEAVCRLVER